MTTTTKTEQLTREDLYQTIYKKLGDCEHLNRSSKATALTSAIVEQLTDALIDRRSIRFVGNFTVTPKVRKGIKRGQIETKDTVYFKVGGRARDLATKAHRNEQVAREGV